MIGSNGLSAMHFISDESLTSAKLNIFHKRKRHMRPLYVFDLDETLIHSTEAPMDTTKNVQPTVLRLRGDVTLYVHVRPGARALLTELLSLQKAGVLSVGVWTAATAEYARKVLRILLGSRQNDIAFLRTRRDCIDIGREGQPRYVKDLRRITSPNAAVVIFDDNADTIKMNKRNGFSAILAKPFHGRRNDRELSSLHDAIVRIVRDCHNGAKMSHIHSVTKR